MGFGPVGIDREGRPEPDQALLPFAALEQRRREIVLGERETGLQGYGPSPRRYGFGDPALPAQRGT